MLPSSWWRTASSINHHVVGLSLIFSSLFSSLASRKHALIVLGCLASAGTVCFRQRHRGRLWTVASPTHLHDSTPIVLAGLDAIRQASKAPCDEQHTRTLLAPFNHKRRDGFEKTIWSATVLGKCWLDSKLTSVLKTDVIDARTRMPAAGGRLAGWPRISPPETFTEHLHAIHVILDDFRKTVLNGSVYSAVATEHIRSGSTCVLVLWTTGAACSTVRTPPANPCRGGNLGDRQFGAIVSPREDLPC